MKYISYVVEALNVVDSSNASDSVVDLVQRSVPIGRAMLPGVPAGPPLRPVAPPSGPSLRQVAPTGPISSSTSGSGIVVRIIEQPAKKSPKFRYVVEGRFAGSIPGANSKKDHKTYPTIEITNYTGKAKIIVSCVTKDKPYRPHPHKLVGRDHCSDGLCVMTVDITPENRVVTFSNIGIQCVKRNDIAASLDLRKEQKIDPFRTGFDHGTSTRDMDLHAVRLCFQVFPGSMTRYHPIVSDIIYNGPKTPDLKILQISHISGSAIGGTKVILLCEEMKHEDVIVTLHTEEGAGGAVTWRAPADCLSFHKNVAVVFDTPPYKDPTTESHITAYIQLQSKSTGERSDSIRFTYEPEPGPEPKRRKPLPKHFLERLENIPPVWYPDAVKTEACGMPPSPVWYPLPVPDAVKMEPCENISPVRMDTSPMSQNSYEPVPHHLRKWNPNTPSTSHTGYNQEFPWPAPVQNQSITHDMHASPIVMPNTNMTVTSPNNPNMNFIPCEMSNQARVTAPPHQFTLPHNNLTSPQDQITLHEGQVNLPQRQVTLPQDDIAGALQGRLLRDQMKSQYRTSQHMPHESVNVEQQSVEHLIASNGDSSILKLLTNGERTYNSGDIAAIAQDIIADGTNDLSDSFSQLMSVSDNLKF